MCLCVLHRPVALLNLTTLRFISLSTRMHLDTWFLITSCCDHRNLVQCGRAAWSCCTKLKNYSVTISGSDSSACISFTLTPVPCPPYLVPFSGYVPRRSPTPSANVPILSIAHLSINDVVSLAVIPEAYLVYLYLSTALAGRHRSSPNSSTRVTLWRRGCGMWKDTVRCTSRSWTTSCTHTATAWLNSPVCRSCWVRSSHCVLL